ncbi:hypothetical protein [Streptomyces sp. MN13]
MEGDSWRRRPPALEPLVHSPENVTAGVRRVRRGERTAVLKVLTCRKEADGRWAASDDPRHWNYWRREAHVYESGRARARSSWTTADGGAGTVSPELRYRERGKALAFLAGWAAQARALAPLLGFPEVPSGR